MIVVRKTKQTVQVGLPDGRKYKIGDTYGDGTIAWFGWICQSNLGTGTWVNPGNRDGFYAFLRVPGKRTLVCVEII